MDSFKNASKSTPPDAPLPQVPPEAHEGSGDGARGAAQGLSADIQYTPRPLSRWEEGGAGNTHLNHAELPSTKNEGEESWTPREIENEN